DGRTKRWTMAFAPGGDPKHPSERVKTHPCSPSPHWITVVRTLPQANSTRRRFGKIQKVTFEGWK
ncbi:MAG: hypothetical protein AAF066_19995, partial [Pseudomonadota bacterium]